MTTFADLAVGDLFTLDQDRRSKTRKKVSATIAETLGDGPSIIAGYVRVTRSENETVRRVVRSANGTRWQAAIIHEGRVLVACGHDDHRTKKDATQCLERITL